MVLPSDLPQMERHLRHGTELAHLLPPAGVGTTPRLEALSFFQVDSTKAGPNPLAPLAVFTVNLHIARPCVDCCASLWSPRAVADRPGRACPTPPPPHPHAPDAGHSAAGTATGRARLQRHPGEGQRLAAGEGLVAPSSDPGCAEGYKGQCSPRHASFHWRMRWARAAKSRVLATSCSSGLPMPTMDTPAATHSARLPNCTPPVGHHRAWGSGPRRAFK